MTYTAKDFGMELLDQVEIGFDVVRIARWAHQKYMDSGIEVEESVQQAILQIVAMEEGPEFEMDEKELIAFANKLINDYKGDC